MPALPVPAGLGPPRGHLAPDKYFKPDPDTPLTQESIQNGALNGLQQALLNPQINFTYLIISNTVATEEGIRQLLRMKLLPGLTKIRFENIVFTEDMMKILLGHNIIYDRLTSLQM